jgi:hypothetical protein
MTISRFFLQSKANFVHQNGAQLSMPTCGIKVVLHIRKTAEPPCCAEVISAEHYAEVGLKFVGETLVDFDGVFFLPREVGETLRDLGFIVSAELFSDYAHLTKH